MHFKSSKLVPFRSGDTSYEPRLSSQVFMRNGFAITKCTCW